MKQKIEWYREVLELEPGSRVFFPLAKLLAADNQIPEAISTLRQGTSRHPDHVEARLLLIELLYAKGEQAAAGELVDTLAGLLRGYPHFLQAWSEHLAASPSMHDAALSLRFFAAALSGKTISWASIIESGLTSLLGEAMPGGESISAPAAHPAPKVRVEPAPDIPIPAPGRVTLPHTSDDGDLPRLSADDDLDVAEEESEETFSLRTRSMADILAEQGDMNGALEIYREILETASEKEKPELQARIVELSQKASQSPAEAEKTSEEEAGPDRNRVVELLESLARRLEARAH